MSTEKTILNHWLNSNGYFTINNLNASGNKNIGILALKFDEVDLVEVIHAEVYCSIVRFSREDASLQKLLKRFKNNLLHNDIKSLVGKNNNNYKLRKVLFAGKLPESGRDSIMEELKANGVELLEFEEILLEVMLSLDTPYYRDEVLRALQLVKFILLAEPKKLAELLNDKGNILNVNSRGIFLNQLLKQELIKKELTKADDKQIIEIIKHTTLRKPDRLAKALEEELLNKRGMNRLLSKLLKSDVHEESDEEEDVKQLNEFF